MKIPTLALVAFAPIVGLAQQSRPVDSTKPLNQPFLTLEANIAGSSTKVLSKSKTSRAIGDLDKIKFNNYFQFQFRDTDQAGKTQHSFEVRRARLGVSMDINEQSSVKVSYDVAGGTARSSGELKDVVFTYKPGQEGLSVIGGQFPLPLGYETATSNTVLEFPERVTVNKTMFNDERVRGIMVQHRSEAGMTVYGGVSNSLTTKDKEQDGLAPGTGGQLAGFAGIKYVIDNMQFGLGYFAGKRPEFVGSVATSPEVDRRFLIADAQVNDLLTPGLYVKAEILSGQDRLPSATGGVGLFANDLNGYHTTVGYKVSALSNVYARLSVFDPNEDTDGDAIREFGISWRYSLGAGTNLTISHETFEDNSVANSPYQVCTIRVQFKF